MTRPSSFFLAAIVANQFVSREIRSGDEAGGVGAAKQRLTSAAEIARGSRLGRGGGGAAGARLC